MDELIVHYFNRFEFSLTQEDIAACSTQGAVDDAVAAVLEEAYIQEQFQRIDPEDIREELAEYGAWDATELMIDEDNQQRVVSIAACSLKEDGYA